MMKNGRKTLLDLNRLKRGHPNKMCAHQLDPDQNNQVVKRCGVEAIDYGLGNNVIKMVN